MKAASPAARSSHGNGPDVHPGPRDDRDEERQPVDETEPAGRTRPPAVDGRS